MDYLDISNLGLYHSFKKASYCIKSALVELIQNSINVFKKTNTLNEKAIIILYWDMDNNKIQIMDNSLGINQTDELKYLWFGFDHQKSFNHHLISSCFYLGSSVSIESKNGIKAFVSELNLKELLDDKNVKINFYENNEILRIFHTGNRITINHLYHKLNVEEINEIYQYLSFIFHHVIQESSISIIFSVIQNGLFIDPSTKELNKLNNIANVTKLKFKLPEINNLKTVMYENEIDDGKHNLLHFEFCAYQFLMNKNLRGISFRNQDHIILENNQLLIPKWFNEDFGSVYVDLKINNLELDLFNSKIMLNQKVLNEILEIIKQKIEPLRIEFPKTFTKPLIDSSKQKYHTKSLDEFLDANKSDDLIEAKEYLTKIFNQTGRINTINDFEIIKDKLHFTYNADDGKKITMNLIKTKAREGNNFEWLQLIPLQENNVDQTYEYDLKINLNHPYFKEFNNDTETIHKLEHFVVCYAIAECITRLDGSDVGQLKYEINKLLWGNEHDIS